MFKKLIMLKINYLNRTKELIAKYSQLSLKQLTQISADWQKQPYLSILKKDFIVQATALAAAVVNKIKHINLYDSQLKAALILDKGVIEELKTGEGKSYVAILNAYYESFYGYVHIISTNEYLSHRDYLNAVDILNALNISSSFVNSDMSKEEKIFSYRKQVVFTTNANLGFDYLRDCTELTPKLRIPRLDYALIDEADLILLDEAKTPLILSNRSNQFSRNIANLTKIVHAINKLNPTEIKIEKDLNNVYLTDEGYKHIAKLYPDFMNNFSDINSVLTAKFLMKKDKDFIIENNAIKLIDQDTGRISDNRQYMYGLQTILEIINKVPVNNTTDYNQEISNPALFNLYKKFSGMTGTAIDGKEEFLSLYNKRIIKIKPHFKNRRKDLPDLLFTSEKARETYLLNQIKFYHKKHYPILIQTIDIKSNQEIASLLAKNGYKFQVINGKTIYTKKKFSKEVTLIKKAGRKSTITIATNVVGRGTDIKLEDERYPLIILGIGRSSNIRLDKQLIGRTGRQGQAGISQFLINANEDFIRNYSNRHTFDMYIKYVLKHPNTKQLRSPIFLKMIKQASEKHAIISSSQAQALANITNVNEVLRLIIYKFRNELLFDSSNQFLNKFVDQNTNQYLSYISQLHLTNIFAAVKRIDFSPKFKAQTDFNKQLYYFSDEGKFDIQKKLNNLSKKEKEGLKKELLIQIDEFWLDLLHSLKKLEKTTQWTKYAGINPLGIYTKKAINIYNANLNHLALQMMTTILGY